MIIIYLFILTIPISWITVFAAILFSILIPFHIAFVSNEIHDGIISLFFAIVVQKAHT